MHIFQNIKTYDRPSPQGERKEPEKYPNSWLGAFKGCLFAIILLAGSIALLCGIGSAIDSSETGKSILFVVGILFILGLVAFYLGTPAFLMFWAFLDKGKGNKYVKLIIGLIITILVVGLILYISGSIGVGTEYIEPGKMRPDRFK